MISFCFVDYIVLGWFKRFNSGVIGHTLFSFLASLAPLREKNIFPDGQNTLFVIAARAPLLHNSSE